MHHPPFTSGTHHGPSTKMRWNFSEIGIDLVLTGHEHIYERLEHEGITYIVDGLGGKSAYDCGVLTPESIICKNNQFGGLIITSDERGLSGRYINSKGILVDEFVIKPSN